MADTSESTRPTWLRDIAILVVAAVVGAGIFALVTRDGDDGGSGVALDLPEQTADGGEVDPDDQPLVDVAAGDGADVEPVAPDDATDPQTAVSSFLAAEVARDFEASYALLDDATASRTVNASQWTAEHAQFPKIVGFEVLGETEKDGAPAVRTALALDAGLDPVVGLVPARAEGTWVVEETDGGSWRVNFDESAIEPLYPDDAGATDAALAWARAVQAGEDASDLQGVSSLAGRAGYVGLVEESSGDFEASGPTALPPDAGNSNILSRFGSDVVGWGRLVSLRGAVDVDVVLAPVDDQWVVIGLVDP